MSLVWSCSIVLAVLISCSSVMNVSGNPSIVQISNDRQISIVSGNEQITLTCKVTGNDLVGVYWERVNKGPLPNQNNMSSLSNGNRTLKTTISKARPEYSGKYRCVAYSQLGVTQSNNIKVTITVAPPVIARQPTNKMIIALQDVTFTCVAKGFEVKYEWKRHNGRVSDRKQSTLTISEATPLDEDQYYCVAMTEGGYAFSNNVSLTVNDSIVITQHPLNTITVATGNMLTLSVTANGPGESRFTYQWKRRGSTPFPSTATGKNSKNLKISSVTSSDSGSYYCVVMNQWGNMVNSNEATVNILSLPVITRHPNYNGPVNMVEGSDVVLTCQATGDGTLTYQWRKESGSLPSNSRSSNGGKTLTLNNITVSDSGQYYCLVDNGGDSVSSMRVQMTIKSKPKITNTPSNKQLHIVSGNEQITLTCKVTGDDISGVYWERVNDGPLPNHRNMSSLSNDKRTLRTTISKARPENSGRYQCVAYSQWGVTRSNSVTVTITIAPPIITRQPTDQMITALQDVMFTCVAKGFEVKYEWKRHNGHVSDRKQSTFTISEATPLDEDQYYCVAMTEGGYAVSNNVTLTVDDQLSIRVTPTSLTVGKGDTAQFTAIASGINMNNFRYQWKKRGSNNLPDKVSGDTGAVLTIPDVVTSDRGKYYCVVTNEWNRTMTSDDVTLAFEGIPEIQNSPSNVTVLNGQPTILTCKAIGTNVTYQWMKDNKLVPRPNSSVLEITNTTESDEGVYKCIASSVGGMAESNPTTVTVYGLPMIKELPQQLHAVLGESFHIICTATNDQDAPVNLIFYWGGPNGVQFNVTTTDEDGSLTATSTLHISNVTHNHGGVYQCTVSNGEHQRNNIFVITNLVVEEQSSPPISFSITHINVTSFQLIWSAPNNPNGIIDHYNVYYSNNNHDQLVQVVSDTNFNGTYTLINLTPYTMYSVYVTAVRLIGDNDRPLEGMKSIIVTGRTLAGVPVIEDVNESRIILNAKDFILEDLYIIDLPAITGFFSYLYIIVVTDNVITNTESISTASLLEESVKSHPLFYVAAVVNRNQYVLGKGLSYILGVGDNTTDIYSQAFYNRQVKDSYFYFFRIYSFDSTPENELYITTELRKIELPQPADSVENASCQNSNTDISNVSLMAIVILAVLLIVSVICLIFLTIFVFKLKMQHQTTDNNKSVQQPSNAPEHTYALVVKHNDDINMEKNPAYAVQDTSMKCDEVNNENAYSVQDSHHYDFISESNKTKAEQ